MGGCLHTSLKRRDREYTCSFIQYQSKMEVLEQKIKNTVCRIEMKDSKCCTYEGTGFLFGNGWVMTAAHNFQDDTERNKGIHNFLLNASFKVSFHVRHPDSPDGTMKKYEFQMQKRTAFAHHLQPGEDANLKDKDIAKVKLGVQYEYAREEGDYKEWEKEEKEKLKELAEFVKPLSEAVTSQPITPGSSVYAVYYQACSNEKKLKEIRVL
ncbi:hypothetical protein AWC38_SpisGene16620 [Stylophora pistillata]|uniref:Peptidase S1 domain-containing protein n=1 Tax=Stylophora pistillata TaxID=50429 RepID=A0A2B4RRJ2_STYPI|nr:hypothetical protein AWC38_SpisGene16620 [Stylophora pistillata]